MFCFLEETHRKSKHDTITIMKTTKTATPEALCIDIVKRLIQEVVLHPEQVAIDHDEDFDSFVVRLPSEGESRKAIGSNGANVEGLKAIVERIAKKHHKTFHLQFPKPGNPLCERYPDTPFTDDWNSAHIVKLVSDIADAVLKYPARVVLKDGAESRTKIKVLTSTDEDPQTLIALNESLVSLFKAIGRGNGRRLLLIEFATDPDWTAAAQASNKGQVTAPNWDPKKW